MFQYHQKTHQDIKALIGIKDPIDGGRQYLKMA
jgi:hypothetical protein